MTEEVNKSLVIRTMFDKGLTMNHIHKATGIRYNMVYNVIERYRARKDFKEPKKYLDKASAEVITKTIEGTFAELGIVMDKEGLRRIK